MNLRKQAVAAVAASIASVGLVIGGASTAGADWAGDYTGSGVNIRKEPFVISGNSKGHGNPGDRLVATCLATNGQVVNGNSGWFRHTNQRTRVTGYSSAEFVGLNPTGSVAIRAYPNAPCTRAP